MNILKFGLPILLILTNCNVLMIKDIPSALAENDKVIDRDLGASDYNQRGWQKYIYEDIPGALADYNQALRLDPKYVYAYNNRGLLKQSRLNDLPGALADYNQAIELNPNFPTAYRNRGVLKKNAKKDRMGAIQDLRQAASLYRQQGMTPEYQDTIDLLKELRESKAIELNPKDARDYANRGLFKQYKLNDRSGALADYNQAIELDSNYALAYNDRGYLKQHSFHDLPGALADYNQAIELDPNYALAYYHRGVWKKDEKKDRAGALRDLRQAAIICRKKGWTFLAQHVIYRLNELGVSK
jgi:tetratricopeptide (TPR) repeat protein